MAVIELQVKQNGEFILQTFCQVGQDKLTHNKKPRTIKPG